MLKDVDMNKVHSLFRLVVHIGNNVPSIGGGAPTGELSTNINLVRISR